MTRSISAAAIALLVSWAGAPDAFAAGVPEPETYRMKEYRAPVPDTLTGARVITTVEAKELWNAGEATFVDVLPRPPKPDLPEGTIWRPKPRLDIPGSIWVPGAGFGTLTPEAETWFSNALAEASNGDKAHELVFYCRPNCWISWNAAKRALEWGYTTVIWFPEGTDGWEEAGLPLEERTPLPRASE